MINGFAYTTSKWLLYQIFFPKSPISCLLAFQAICCRFHWVVMAKFLLQEGHAIMFTQAYFGHSMVLRGPVFFETDTYWLNLIPFRDAILISLVSHSSPLICFKKKHFQTIADALRLDVLHLVRIPVLPGKHWFNLYGSAILAFRFC